MTKTFQFTAAEVTAKMADYQGRCAVSQEVERYRRANGMRTGLNLTTDELEREALWRVGR